MRLGSCHLWGDDLAEFRREVRKSGELGFEVIAIGDSPAAWHDLYLSMLVAAQEAPRAAVTPYVTSPFLRHPLVTANSLCSLAGEQADGVILFTNHDLDEFDRKLEVVRAAARKAGRTETDVDVWATAFTSIRSSRAEAIADLKAFIVVNGMAIRTPELLARVPDQYRAALTELHRRYDPTEHTVVGGKNARLLDELGLTEFLSQFDTVAGPPAEVKRVLDGLAARGVSTFIANLPGHADKLGTLRRLAELKRSS